MAKRRCAKAAKGERVILYRSLKIKVYNVGVRGREFTETKYVFLRLDGRRWANGDWGELEILLKVTGARCHLCGKRIAWRTWATPEWAEG